jgi:aminopeptidase N
MILRHTATALMGAISLAAAAGPAIADTPALQVPSQLPRNAKPLHYAIRLTPDSEKLSFSATVRIDIEMLATSRSVTLNAVDLAIASAAISGGPKARVTLNPAAQTATLTFPTSLRPGKYSLEIAYAGKIYQQANGLFALDYKNPQGAQKRALFTQFEAPDARRFVPSWDEPNYKATFDLMAVVPADHMAVSNMPISNRRDLGGGMVEVTFQQTPKMSSYLLFFGAGEFDRITKQVGATEVGVVMGRGNAAKGQYALEAAAKVVPYYNDYFGVNYPLPKLDNVAGPGQSQFFGAMENWGAIFTFEAILLDDPKITSARGRQRIYSTAGHEIAHQWFGNLVTMQWWDDLWLNEGFASWMETKATAHFNPTWEALLDRVGGREAAMGLDAVATTHPVIQKIQTVEQTSQAFDTITYQKGEAVITMLEGFAGEDVWRDGIRAYMKAHAYGNTRTDDLWTAVEGAGAKGLVQVAHDFTKQPGIPLIRIESAECQDGSTQLTLSQGEFSRDRKAKTDVSPQRWNVPVIAQVIGGQPVRTLVSSGKGSLSVPGCGTTIVNAGQSGYYRTLYTPAMSGALKADFAKLAPIDQLGLLNDNLNLSYGDYQPMAVALDLLGAVPADASPHVVEDAADSWAAIYDRFRDDPAIQTMIAARASRVFGPRLEALGFAPKPEEIAPVSNLRTTLIEMLGKMGDRKVLSEAKRLFAALDGNPAALDGPLRTTWLGIIALNADRPTWDKMRRMGQEAETQVVRIAMYRLLGAPRDKALAQAALDLALTDEPGPTTSAGMISQAAGEHPDLTVDFSIANRMKVESLVDVSSRSEYIAGLAARSRDPAMIGKLEAYAKAYLTPQSRKPIDQAIVALNTRLASEPRIKIGVKEWLARN